MQKRKSASGCSGPWTSFKSLIFANGITEKRVHMAEMELAASRHTVWNLSTTRLQYVGFALFLTKYEIRFWS